VLAWALWALGMTALGAVPLLDRLLRQAGRADLVQLTLGTVWPALAMVSGATVGAVLASRRPRHPVGWLLLALALSLTVTAAAAQYLTWGLLTILLGVGYAGVVLGLGRLLPQGSTLVVAAATLAVAAAFQPARRRVQQLVDRRFDRRRYDAARTIAAFSARLRQQVGLDPLTAELLGVVEQTVQPTSVSLWLRPTARP
jgi:hypothetical protein